MSRATWTLIAAGALVVAAWFTYLGTDPEYSDTANLPSHDVRDESSSDAAIAATVAAAGDVRKEDYRFVSLGQRFDQATDLYSFYQDMRSKADAGSSEALWFSYKVMDYCSKYAANPSMYASDTDALAAGIPSGVARSLKSARSSIAHRCRGFAGGAAYSHSSLKTSLEAAAAAGNLAAEATLLVNGYPLSTSPEYPRELVKSILASGDPEAYLAISSAMGPQASSGGAAVGPVAGTADAALAWQLAACRKGLDCSATGSLMRSYCVNGGVCGPYASFQDLVFHGLVPRGERSRVKGLVEKIVEMEKGQWN